MMWIEWITVGFVYKFISGFVLAAHDLNIFNEACTYCS